MTRTIEVDFALPKYARGLFDRHRYKVLYGGRGAGRSWSVGRALVWMAHRQPLRVLCAREFQNSIADSVHRLLSDQIDMLGLSPLFDITQREIRSSAGALFLFEGLRHNVTKIKSLEGIDVCWVEEAEKVSEASWNVLIPTIRKAGSEIWITFNPDQETDPTFRRFVQTPPPDAWVRKVGYADNPWFPDELRREMEHLRRVDPDAAAWVWDGECRSISDAQVFRGKWRVEPFEPQAHWDGPYYGADWGFAQDPTTLVRVWVSDNRLFIEYEAYGVGVDIDRTPELFERVPEARTHLIRADSARPETISYMSRQGFRIQGVQKWAGSVEDGVSHMRGYDEIVIHPRCRNAAAEFRLYSHKTDRLTGDVMPQIIDAHNHVIDAIRYALQPMIRRKSEPRVRVL